MHDQQMPAQGNVYGGETVTAYDPNPPRTEAPQMFQQELEQRHSEAMAKAEFHGAESRSWRSVAVACGGGAEVAVRSAG